MRLLFKHLLLCSLHDFAIGSFTCFCVPDAYIQAFMCNQYLVLYKHSLISLNLLISAYFSLEDHNHTNKTIKDLHWRRFGANALIYVALSSFCFLCKEDQNFLLFCVENSSVMSKHRSFPKFVSPLRQCRQLKCAADFWKEHIVLTNCTQQTITMFSQPKQKLSL